MIKKDLIDNVAALSGKPKTVVREVLDALCDVSTAALATGDSVMLAGLGKLSVSRRGEKRARNLKTGDVIIVPPRNAVMLSASDSLLKAVNAG